MFRNLALSRIIEPTSKLDSLRVLAEAGIDPPAPHTITAADPLDDELRNALDRIHGLPGAH